MNESSLLLQEFVKIKLVFVDQVLQEVSQICPVFEMLLLVRQVFNVIYRVVELFELNFLFVSVLLRQFAVKGLVESFQSVEMGVREQPNRFLGFSHSLFMICEL